MNDVFHTLNGGKFMSNFKEFQKEIKALGTPWNTDDVYFNQERDGYAASYKPMYPEYCNKDIIIQTIYNTGAYKRGNYELIIHDGTKFHSLYFMTMQELRNYFSNR